MYTRRENMILTVLTCIPIYIIDKIDDFVDIYAFFV